MTSRPSRQDRAIRVIATIGVVVVVVAGIVAVIQLRDDEPTALTTSTSSIAPTTSAGTTPPPTGATTTTTTSATTTTTGASTTTAPASTTTVPSATTTTDPAAASFATVTAAPDGVYLDATRLFDGPAEVAAGWVDGTLVFQRSNAGIEIRSTDGSVTAFDPGSEPTLVGAGTVEDRRILLYITEEPMSEGGIDFSVQRLWWHDIDTGDEGEIGIISGFESGWSAISTSDAAVAVGWVGEGLAGLSAYDLAGAPVVTGIPLEFEFDAFVTPWVAPDGSTLVSHDGQQLEAWDVASGTVTAAFDLPDSSTPPAIVGFDGSVAYLVVDDGAETVTVAADDGGITGRRPGTVRPLLPMP